MVDNAYQSLTMDQLETVLTAAEGDVARSRAVQLSVIRELDARQAHAVDGSRSLQEWLAGRLDVAADTAKDLVRTARGALDAAVIEHELADGTLSFDRAAATIRLAAAGADEGTVEWSRGYDIAGVRRMTARHRRSADHGGFDDRYLVIQPNLDESSWSLWGTLPGYEGRVVEKALLDRADTLPAAPEGVADGRSQRAADALVSVCQDSLTGTSDVAGAPVATIHVDASILASSGGTAGITVEGGPAVALEVLEGVLCSGAVEMTVTAEGGTPLALGRTTRAISPRLRRHILHRDGGCTIDGCTSRYRLQPHHIVPWSEGGATDPNNLSTLCWFHHHVVIHGHGFTLDPSSPPQRRRFIRRHRRGPP